MDTTYTFENIETSIKVDTVGLLQEIIIKCKSKKDSAAVKYTLGYASESFIDKALILTRKGINLNLSGNSFIQGDVGLKSAKITQGNMFGVRNNQKYYHKGSVVLKDTLNEKIFNEKLIEQIFKWEINDYKTKINQDFIIDEYSYKEMEEDIYEISGNLTIKGKLNKKTNKRITIFVQGETTIENDTESNVYINLNTKEKVLVKNNVQLKNINILSDKSIDIKSNSYFQNTQIISKDSISISESQFDYPTYILLYNDSSDKKKQKKTINLMKSKINGSVLLLLTTTGINENMSKISIDEASIIKGFVYSENYVELKGKIYGSAHINTFWYYKKPTEYINWIVNGIIERDKLETGIILPVGLNTNTKLKVLKELWL